MSTEEKAFNAFFKKLKKEGQQPEVGKVLLSEPFLEDPNFIQSVILLIQHNEEGSMGFVLNQESQLTINEVLPDFPEFDAPVFIGGPVSDDNLFVIHDKGDLIENSFEIANGIYWGGDFEQLKSLIISGAVDSSNVLFVVGYSGWEADQLNQELDAFSWIVSNINKSDVFSKQGKELWIKLLVDLDPEFKILNNFPQSPYLN